MRQKSYENLISRPWKLYWKFKFPCGIYLIKIHLWCNNNNKCKSLSYLLIFMNKCHIYNNKIFQIRQIHTHTYIHNRSKLANTQEFLVRNTFFCTWKNIFFSYLRLALSTFQYLYKRNCGRTYVRQYIFLRKR